MQNLHGHLATPQVLTYRLPYLQPTLPTAYHTYPLSHHHHHHHHHRSAIFVQTLSRIAGIVENELAGGESKGRGRLQQGHFEHAVFSKGTNDEASGD